MDDKLIDSMEMDILKIDLRTRKVLLLKKKKKLVARFGYCYFEVKEMCFSLTNAL